MPLTMLVISLIKGKFMGTFNLEQAKQYALQRLEKELSPNLLYHGIQHTRDEVIPAVQVLADMEGIQGGLRAMLVTGAWFHDLGFIEGMSDHESVSARLAAEVLPGFGYTSEQIDVVKGIIMATVVPQSPKTHLEQIMADADLDVLGHDDFMLFNSNLRRELALVGQEFTDLDWYSRQLQFLESHTYFTASARVLRDAGQLKNIRMIKKKLAET
jgi:uncharacterized protein